MPITENRNIFDATVFELPYKAISNQFLGAPFANMDKL